MQKLARDFFEKNANVEVSLVAKLSLIIGATLGATSAYNSAMEQSMLNKEKIDGIELVWSVMKRFLIGATWPISVPCIVAYRTMLYKKIKNDSSQNADRTHMDSTNRGQSQYGY